MPAGLELQKSRVCPPDYDHVCLIKLGVILKFDLAVLEGIVAVISSLTVPEYGGLMFPHLKYRWVRYGPFPDYIHHGNATTRAFPEPDDIELKVLCWGSKG